MPELSQNDWNTNKRKNRVSGSETNSTDGDWESSSASAPNTKRNRWQSDWASAGSEAVGDNDGLQLLGRELFEQTTSSSGHAAHRKKVGFNQSNVGLNGGENHGKDLQGSRKVDDVAAHAKNGEPTGREPPIISLNTTRNCMHALIGELREARKQMLQWMRQEMHNFLQEVPGSPPAHRRFLGQSGGVIEVEETEKKTGSMSASILSSSPTGIQFGWQGSGTGEVKLARQINGVDNRAGYGGQCNSSRGGDSNFRMQDSGNCREDVGLNKMSGGNNKGMGILLAEQKNALVDMGFEIRSGGVGFGEQSREAGGLDGGLQSGRVEIGGGFERQNESGGTGFPVQSSLRGDTGFGVQTCSDGRLGYGGQRSDGAAMSFKGSTHESGHGGASGMADLSTLGLRNLNPSSNGAGNHLGSALRMSSDEGKTDLMGIHNQTATGEMQNPVPVNMMWNMMSQSGRTVNHVVPESRVSSFNYEAHGKLVNGGIGSYRGLAGSSSGYDNSLGMMNSAVLENPNAAVGMQLPLSMQSASPSSNSGMPMLLGMQSQVPVQNPSNMQNFLGLSMNGLSGAAVNRQVFPGLYLQDNSQHSLASAKQAPMSSSPTVHVTSYRRGTAMQGRGILELNS